MQQIAGWTLGKVLRKVGNHSSPHFFQLEIVFLRLSWDSSSSVGWSHRRQNEAQDVRWRALHGGRWEGGYCRAFAEVRLLDVRLTFPLQILVTVCCSPGASHIPGTEDADPGGQEMTELVAEQVAESTQGAYSDAARRVLWYLQCPGYEDTRSPEYFTHLITIFLEGSKSI